MEWIKEKILDYIKTTGGLFASSKLNRIFSLMGPLLYINPPLPGEIGLLLYTTSYSHPTQNTCNIELNKLEVPIKPDKLESPLPTLEDPQELTEPAVKHSQGHP